MILENLHTNFSRIIKYFPDGFFKVEYKDDAIKFQIGDADISLDENLRLNGCGRRLENWREWKIIKRESPPGE